MTGTESPADFYSVLQPGTWQVGTDRTVLLCCYPRSHPGDCIVSSVKGLPMERGSGFLTGSKIGNPVSH